MKAHRSKDPIPLKEASREQLHARIREHLKSSEFQADIRQRLKDARENLSISISQAAKIVDVTQAQLRYWESSLKLLLSERTPSSVQDQQAAKHPGQRRYSLRDLTRLLIIKDLHVNKHYSLDEITQFLANEKDIIDEAADEIALPLKTTTEFTGTLADLISQPEEVLSWRAFVPRALYLSLSLLFGQAISGDTGLFLPIHPGPIKVEDRESLSMVGEMLVGWHTNTRHFSTFLVNRINRPIIEFLQRYSFTPLSWRLESASSLFTIYLASSERPTALLSSTDPAATKAATRLLHYLQEHSTEWRPCLQSIGDYLIYDPPSTIDPNASQHVMNKIAEAIVQLGGMRKVTEQGYQELRPRWRFSCIFLPKDLSLPLQQRSIVVHAQSKQSPHQVGITTLGYGRATGISLIAFQSGQIVYRRVVADKRLDIKLHDIEGAVGSAIAVPIEGEYGQPMGVLYIVSDEPEAFSHKDDLLLLRMMGRIIRELLTIQRTRYLMVSDLPEVIARPERVDRFFNDFESEMQYVDTLEELLGKVKKERRQTLSHLAFIAINVDGVNRLETKYGDLAERNLVKAVGLRIQEWCITLDEPEELLLYYMYADRFFLLLKNVPLDKAIKYARQLQATLREHYFQIEATRRTRGQYIPPGHRLGLQITAHFAVTGYDYPSFKKMLASNPKLANVRAKLTHTLEEALRLGRDQGGNNIVVWDPTSDRFSYEPARGRTWDESSEDQYARLIEKTIDKFTGEAASEQKPGLPSTEWKNNSSH